MVISDDRKRRLVDAAGADLVALGLSDSMGPNRFGQVLLAESAEMAPQWLGFEVYRWPGSIRQDPGSWEPVEQATRAAPVLAWLEAIANQAADFVGVTSGGIRGTTKAIARELLVNAVVHRDYDVQRPIDVHLYVDGASICSPGLPVDDVQLESGAFSGVGARNPELAYAARYLGMGLQQGRGWPTLVRRASDAGLRISAAVEGDDVWVDMELDVERQLDLEEAARKAKETRVRFPRESWDERILEQLSDGAWWKPSDLVARLGIPRSSLTSSLNRLEQAGRVERREASPRSPLQSWRRLDP